MNQAHKDHEEEWERYYAYSSIVGGILCPPLLDSEKEYSSHY
jgi:hypothetical protein